AVSLSGTYTGFRPELLGKARNITLQLRSNFDLSILTCNAINELQRALCAATARRVRGTSIYSSIGPVIRVDLRDDSLDPHAGAYFELASSVAKGLDPLSPDFLRAE